MNSQEFRRSYAVTQDQLRDNDYDAFSKSYFELLNYLKSIDFSSIFSTSKANIENSETPNLQNEVSESKLSDETIYKIISHINFLSKPEYKQYWSKIIIPNRSSEPNYENLSEADKLKAKSQYEDKLKKEETEIKLMTYINELYKKILIYENHSIREYHINLCTVILLQYVKSHPQEVTKIHFRFKSPKELAIKLAKNIIVNSHFERNPQTSTDTLVYKDISDVFGAKIVSERGYCPHASSNEQIQSLITQRDQRIKELVDEGHEIFAEKIDEITSGEDSSLRITYGEYYNKCLDILTKHKEIINPNEYKVIKYIEQQISYITEQIEDADNRSILDEDIKLKDYKIFHDPQTNYKQFLTAYQKRIISPLSLAGLKKGLNKIFYNPGTTDNEIIESSILSSFGIRVHKAETKSTSSGHEAVHYDIDTPYGQIEIQAQDNGQYEFDKASITAAHGLMSGKGVPLFKIPKLCDTSFITNSEDFYEIKTRDGTVQYYKKSDIQEFLEKVELLTAKKGKIVYNEGLENAQIDLYSSFYNYYALAMELPETHPYRAKVQQYFSTLQEKPFLLKSRLFKHFDTRSKHITFQEIKDFILPFKFGKNASANLDSKTQSDDISKE